LGIGDWGLGPIPNPQSPIPNPQSPIPIKYIHTHNIKSLKIIIKINLKYYLKNKNVLMALQSLKIISTTNNR
jgi:hypothetical protein